jgi:DNA polymerase-3 subunit alpha
MTSDPFVHLRTHSAYSLLEGALTIKKLVGLCAEHQMPAVALTDRDNLFGSMEFSLAAAGAGVQPIIGVQLSVLPMTKAEPSNNASKKHAPDQLMLYAKDDVGYYNLLKLVSSTYIEPEGGEAPLVTYAAVAKYSEGVLALTAGQYGAVGRALLAGHKDEAVRALQALQQIFPDRLYMELMRHGMPNETKIEDASVNLAIDFGLPLVATNDVYFYGGREMYYAHDALLCVAAGTYVSENNRRRLTPEHRFKSSDEMKLQFADLPEAIVNTRVVAQRCATMSPKRKPILPSYEMLDDKGERLSEEQALRTKAADGLKYRLNRQVYRAQMTDEEKEEIAKPYWARLQFELDVISEMKFPGYFLIVSDFITWSKEQGIPVGPGRGSGAASVVAWSLLITDLDPLKYDLVFERFLNPERVSMPDFDIDFCQDRREEVIRYVQQKYGRDQVAQIITFGKLQARAVLRDVGRVLQMPYSQVDRICKLVPNNPANPVTLDQAIEMEPELKRQMQDDEEVGNLVRTSLKLEGLYRHCSTHAAGVVIADRPLENLVPLYRDPRSDMPVVQYSMKYAEEAGLVKFDFLGLKTLTVLQKAVEFIARRGIEVDLLTVPLDDAPSYKLLADGNTVGVFQFESAGMQDALRKMIPDCLEDLIALAALYRPGPMDNIPVYIACKHGKEKPDYMHPTLEPVLKETFGVIIYQEQVQRIAQVLSGYTLGGADLLRRAMGKKIKEEMDQQREKFVVGAEANGIDKKLANAIFDHVAKFAGYGFNKAHAAAYGFIGYQTAYLKANYAAEFFAASMTYDMHNTDKLAIFKEDASQMGIEILPPDINKSFAEFNVEIVAAPVSSSDSETQGQESEIFSGEALDSSRSSGERSGSETKRSVRYALAALKNVGAQAMQDLVAEREAHGAYVSIFDVMRRSGKVMNRRQLEMLIKAGVFDSLHDNRQQLFETVDALLAYANAVNEEKNSTQISLFGGSEAGNIGVREPAYATTEDWMPLTRLEFEFSAVGFYLSSHPLEAYARVLERLKVVPSSLIASKARSEYAPMSLAGIVTGKKVKVGQRGRFAFLTLSDASGVFEVSIFDEELLAQSRELLENGMLLHIKADAKGDEGGVRIIATSIRRLDDAARDVSSGNLTIFLDEHHALDGIRQLIGQSYPRQGMNVTLQVAINDNKRAEVRLKGVYRIPPEHFMHMKNLTGVTKIIEA